MTIEIPKVFGSVFFEEMPLSHFDGKQWQAVQWQASDALTLHAGAHVFHYGSACFEGLKAFRHADDKIVVYRLNKHIERMRNSARLLHLPVPDADVLSEMIQQLVAKAVDYVPAAPGSLYLRPTLIGTDPVIGKAGAPSIEAMLYVLASPVGDYFVPGAQMRVVIETAHQRCAPHMGAVKSGGNYASALHWLLEAKAQYDAQQVLFCPNGDVQETGASNFIMIEGNTVITRSLCSEFLHGVTRDSALHIAKDLGYEVRECEFSVAELKQAIENGAEAALTGTAAVIAPVTSFIIDGEEVMVQNQAKCLALREAIMAVQYGQAPDKHNWLTEISLG